MSGDSMEQAISIKDSVAGAENNAEQIETNPFEAVHSPNNTHITETEMLPEGGAVTMSQPLEYSSPNEGATETDALGYMRHMQELEKYRNQINQAVAPKNEDPIPMDATGIDAITADPSATQSPLPPRRENKKGIWMWSSKDVKDFMVNLSAQLHLDKVGGVVKTVAQAPLKAFQWFWKLGDAPKTPPPINSPLGPPLTA